MYILIFLFEKMVFTVTEDDSDVPSVSLATGGLDDIISFDPRTFKKVLEEFTGYWRDLATYLDIDNSVVRNSCHGSCAPEAEYCDYLLVNISRGGRWPRTLRQLGEAIAEGGFWTAFQRALPDLMNQMYPPKPAAAPVPVPVRIPEPVPIPAPIPAAKPKKFYGCTVKEKYDLIDAIEAHWEAFYLGYGRDPEKIKPRFHYGASIRMYAAEAVANVCQNGTTAEELAQVLWNAKDGCLRGAARQLFPDLCANWTD